MSHRAVLAMGGLVGAIVVSTAFAATDAVRVGAVMQNSLGSTILVDGSGRALYHLTSEKGKAIRCSGSCARAWPPVIVPGGTTAKAGAGVTRSRLGIIKRPDGRWQATYAGLALYRYAADAPGSVAGQGIGKVWYVINAAGKIVTRAPVDPSTGGATDGGGTGGGGTGGDDGGGYGY